MANAYRYAADLEEIARPEARPSPGKVTLTSRLAPRPRGDGETPVQCQPAETIDPGAANAAWDDLFTVLAPGGAAVQRQHDGGAAPSADATRAIAAHGVAGAGSELPHLATLQASFGDHGTALGGVRAFVGGEAATASRAMGAQAYATGDAIAFAAAPSLFTAAHEAAHVVQQQAGVDLPGGVGQVGDAYERHADAVAARVVAGRSAADLLPATGGGAAGTAVQRQEAEGAHSAAMAESYDAYDASWQAARDDVAAPAPGAIFTGGSLEAAPVGGRSRGQAGFGRELALGGSRQATEELKKGAYGVTAAPVAAYTLTLDGAMRAQNEFIEAKTKATEHARYHDKPWEVSADPSHVTASKNRSIAEASANLAMLERHEFEQWNWVNAYNSWAPTANVAGAARADLIETAALLGFDLTQPADIAKFVKSVEEGLAMATDLVDAEVLGRDGETSWADRASDKGAIGAGPELKGDAITPLMEDLQAAYANVTTAQMGVYRTLLTARTKALKNEKASTEGQLAGINGVIAFWTNMAGLVEAQWPKAMDLASGKTAAKLDLHAANVVAHGEASRNWKSAATRAQAGKETALQSAEIERANAARERITGEEGGGGMSLSLSGLVGGLVSLSFKDQIESLQARIAALESSISAKEAVIELAAAREAMKGYADKVQVLKTKAERLQQASLANRETQYLDAGDSLDRYARAHAAPLKKKGDAALVPGSDKREIYSTLMVIVAKIRAYMLMADSARAMFPYDEFVDQALALSHERREPWESPERKGAPEGGHWAPPDIPAMSEGENKVWETVDGNYAGVFGKSEKARIQFEHVVDLVTMLLQKMKGTDAKTSAAAQNEY